MDTIAMSMNGCSIGHEVPVVEEYGDEVLCAGWNPQLTLAGEGPVAPLNRHVSLLSDFASTDADTFLKNMYAYQC